MPIDPPPDPTPKMTRLIAKAYCGIPISGDEFREAIDEVIGDKTG